MLNLDIYLPPPLMILIPSIPLKYYNDKNLERTYYILCILD